MASKCMKAAAFQMEIRKTRDISGRIRRQNVFKLLTEVRGLLAGQLPLGKVRETAILRHLSAKLSVSYYFMYTM